MLGFCPKCGRSLSQYNPGPCCHACQVKKIDKLASGDKDYYDAEDLADILGFKSTESVKRLGRKGKLPLRVPAVKKWLWAKDVFDEWIRGGHQPLAPDQAQRVLVVEWPGSPPVKMYEKVNVLVVDAEGKIKTDTVIVPSATTFFLNPL